LRRPAGVPARAPRCGLLRACRPSRHRAVPWDGPACGAVAPRPQGYV